MKIFIFLAALSLPAAADQCDDLAKTAFIGATMAITGTTPDDAAVFKKAMIRAYTYDLEGDAKNNTEKVLTRFFDIGYESNDDPHTVSGYVKDLCQEAVK